ncbi:MAG: hypothetical protein RLZZ387_5574 [Chloroflexota bacterium]
MRNPFEGMKNPLKPEEPARSFGPPILVRASDGSTIVNNPFKNARRTLVKWKKGQYIVIDDVYSCEIIEATIATEDGERVAIEGLIEVSVFDDAAEGEAYAIERVTEYAEDEERWGTEP